jgi:hypothetical protein
MIDRDDRQDDELKKLLGPLKSQEPNDLQMQKWQNAVRAETKKKLVTLGRTKYAAQIIAALLIGVIMGAVLFKQSKPMSSEDVVASTFSSSDATYEYSHTNLD